MTPTPHLALALALLLAACGPKGETGRPGDDTGHGDDTGASTDGGAPDGGGTTDGGGTSDGGGTPDGGGTSAPDADGDGTPDSDDCSPKDPAIHPGAAELCNERDDDCDGWVDDDDPDGVSDGGWWYPDGDGDGYGATDGGMQRCEAPIGFIEGGGDCDDSRADVSPAEEEVCDDVLDNDCDGSINHCRVDGVYADDLLTARTWDVGSPDGEGDPDVTPELSLMGAMPAMNGVGQPGVVMGSRNQVCNGRVDVLALDAPSGRTSDRSVGWVVFDGIDPPIPECSSLVGSIGAGVDVDSDGYSDLLIGAPGQPLYDATGHKVANGLGYIYIVPGPVVGEVDAWTDAAWVRGLEAYELLGTSIVAVPDLDGDGVIDLAVGAERVDGTVETVQAKALMLFAGPLLDGVDREAPLATWLGDRAGIGIYTDVAAAGDLDGDGVQDIAFGDYIEECVYVIDTALRGDLTLLDAPVVIGDSGDQDTDLGQAIAGAFDIDADGYDDLLVGAPKTDASMDYVGQVAVFRGPLVGAYQLSDADVQVTGSQSWGKLGQAVHAADLDGLGGDDIVLGQPCYDYRCESGTSQVVVFYAPEDGHYQQTDADLTILGRSSSLGSSGAGPGYVDSVKVDGVTHLLLGAGHGHHVLDLDPERPGGELPGTVDLVPLPGW